MSLASCCSLLVAVYRSLADVFVRLKGKLLRFFTGMLELYFCSVMCLNSGIIKADIFRSFISLRGVSGDGSLITLSLCGVTTFNSFGVERPLERTDFGVASLRITSYDSESFGDDVLRIFKTFYFNG